MAVARGGDHGGPSNLAPEFRPEGHSMKEVKHFFAEIKQRVSLF